MTLLKEGGMSAPAWAFFTTLITLVSYNVREAIRARKRVEENIRLSEPTGNGFTKQLWLRLDKIDSRLDTLEDDKVTRNE